MRCGIAAEEELWVSTRYRFSKSISVFWFFGDGLAEVERLTRDGVDSELKVMCGDGACDIGGQGKDSIDSFRGCSVFEDDSKVGEGVGDLGQVGKEVFLSV
jgi:hypothetical protein